MVFFHLNFTCCSSTGLCLPVGLLLLWTGTPGLQSLRRRGWKVIVVGLTTQPSHTYIPPLPGSPSDCFNRLVLLLQSLHGEEIVDVHQHYACAYGMFSWSDFSLILNSN